MRTIKWTKAFKQDYRKALSTPRHRDLGALLVQAGNVLASDGVLAERYRDHELVANILAIANAI